MLGRIGGAFGVRGWLSVRSYTCPPENILNYSRWWLSRSGKPWQVHDLFKAQLRGRKLTAALSGVEDRDQARAWNGARIAVPRSHLPDPGPGSYYWCDLLGCTVFDQNGKELGRASRILETGGAHEVLVVSGKCEYLVPLVMGRFVEWVDIGRGAIRLRGEGLD